MSHQDCHNHCDNDRKVKGNLKVCKKLKVKGDTTLEQNLDVKGKTTTNELKVLSDAEICGDLDVKGTLNAEGGIIIDCHFETQTHKAPVIMNGMLAQLTQEQLAALEAIKERAQLSTETMTTSTSFFEFTMPAHTRSSATTTTTISVKNIPLLEQRFALTPANRKLQAEFQRLAVYSPEQYEKLRLECAMKHLKEQREKGNMIEGGDGTKKGPNFEPHQLAEVNSILYGFSHDTSTKHQQM